MRVLHIISSGGMYGAEAVILNMSRMLNESGHTSILGIFFNSTQPNLQLHEAATLEGIESHMISCSGRVDWKVSSRIRELARQTRADIVHAHGYKGDIYVYFAMRGSGTPFVSTCHNWVDNTLSLLIYGWIDRLVLSKYSAVVSVSKPVHERLIAASVPPQKLRLIANGIDTRPFGRAQPALRDEIGECAGPTIGFIGRLSHEKGADIFVQAAASVLKEIAQAGFVIVGDGPDRDKLEHLIDELQIRHRVWMLGRRTDMPAVYASLDIMVSSSRQEGLPMAILEGMASRKAIVATAVGEVPSLIKDGHTGLLVQTNDAAALAAAIITLAQDSALRAKVGQNARDLVEADFSAGRMTADYLRLYEDAVNAHKRGEPR